MKRSKTCQTYPGAARQRGVTLIEILVAVVLLAVGLLGLAGLQLRGMQVNQGSQWRSMAAVMAEDLADRMRAQVTVDNSTDPAGAGFLGTYAAGVNNPSLPASLQNWLDTTLPALPAGVVAPSANVPCGTVLPCVQVATVGAAAPAPVRIDVYWNDARASQGANETNTVGSYHVVTMLAD